MSETPNLKLPYIMAAQAQKHVTHNEAIRHLDAIVQLSILDRDLATPPGAPLDGDRYIVATQATGDWAGKEGQIAAWQDGAWMFHVPQEGWICWVADEDMALGYDGAAWGTIASGGSVNPVPLVGVNTTADTTNRLAVKSDAVLFSHDDVTPGSGDVRHKLNKAASADTASFLYQTNYSGRAEIGLAGDDDFHFKVSPDGSSWFESIVLNKDTGVVSFQEGVDDLGIGPMSGFRNMLINGSGKINQRGFAGGSLAAGSYGYDRWKAGAGGCTVSVSGAQWSLNGPLEQMIEDPDLENKQVTLSVENPSNGISVDVGSQSGTIPSGSGRQSATLTLGAGDTGNILVRLNPSTTTTFKNIQLEEGAVATPFERRPSAVEEALCMRYFSKSYDSATAPGTVTGISAITTRSYDSVRSIQWVSASFPIPMRTIPTTTVYALDGTLGVSWSDTGSPPTTASPTTTGTLGSVGQKGFARITGGAAHNWFSFHYTADAEL